MKKAQIKNKYNSSSSWIEKQYGKKKLNSHGGFFLQFNWCDN